MEVISCGFMPPRIVRQKLIFYAPQIERVSHMIEIHVKGISALLLALSVYSCGNEVEQRTDSANTLKIATWNIEHLRELEGVGDRARTSDDFEQLSRIAVDLDADVIALQEVENKKAVEKVFPSSEYQVFTTTRVGRYSTQRTGFAVRNGLKVYVNGEYQYLDVTGNRNLRYGLDITVQSNEHAVRLMSVHLKAGCVASNDPEKSESCRVRLDQTEPLENWIDKRAIEGDTFIVLGDFNRQYEKIGEQEWDNLDDDNPTGADLTRVTHGRTQTCNKGKYKHFIDHIVLGQKAAGLVVEGSFVELTFDNEKSSDGEPPSDHCPQSIILSLDR